MTDAPTGILALVRERLAELGITLTVEPTSKPASDSQTGMAASLSFKETEARYIVTVKARATLTSLARGTSPQATHPTLVVTDRISPRSATALRQAGVQFIDGLGNAHIRFGDVLIEVHGRTGDGPPHGTGIGRQPRPANMFSPRRAQVTLALLTWPELAGEGVRPIAHAAGVSVGQAHEALAQLRSAGFLASSSGELHRLDELLDFWSAAYPAGLARRLELARYHGDLSKPVQRTHAEQRFFFSGESAKGADIARPATLTIYVDALDPRTPVINRWSASPDHVPNVFVRQKFWHDPHPQDAPNAPWPLVYADLMAAGDARLIEVAKTWRARSARSDQM
ncbi:hypothetical protein J2S43_008082 [Catenuloplanes nepalensis]|uniref:Uncharacterized protein n=1 Tax=Catenuloplanes nepalensis TaxID=587533 RepID=A0ABT9N794_9ACTN|nr:type IV toxin-antitoxin system AbiEi family antitoxin [Catenuloplanes nepalensis]MDP9799570.1 hypothetical protein [Catenuloplanes nepalensis]